MVDNQKQADNAIQSIIMGMHRSLVDKFTGLADSRQLSEQENQLLAELDRASPKYQQLVGLMAIESYMQHLVQSYIKSEPILEILALVLSSLGRLSQEMAKVKLNESLQKTVDEIWKNLGVACQISHQMFPNSPLVQVHNGFLNTRTGQDPSESIYERLYDENMDLKSKLEQNDQQILNLEINLTKLLNEQEAGVANGDLPEPVKLFELRDELALRQAQIQQMNEDFSRQIQKYNVVYEAMKREIEELREYRQMDLIDYIEKLETDIVKLREQSERDAIIIRNLRNRSNEAVSVNSYSGNSFKNLNQYRLYG